MLTLNPAQPAVKTIHRRLSIHSDPVGEFVGHGYSKAFRQCFWTTARITLQFGIATRFPIHEDMTSESNSSEDRPDDSSLFWGPANWFSLRIPGDLLLEQTEAFLEIRPGSRASGSDDRQAVEESWSLTLYAAWVKEEEPVTTAASFSPAAMFPGLVQCSSTAPLEINVPNHGWTGTSLRSTGPWWKKLFQRRNSYQWRLWVIEYEQIIVVASLQTTLTQPLDISAVHKCEELLTSISFADELALPPDLFRRDVLELARKHFPLLDIQASGTFGLQINDSEIHLTNFYRSYLKSPSQFRQIVLPGLTTVVRLQEWGPEQLMPELSVASQRIMPMLYPADETDGSLKDFVQLPWVAGLNIMFVLDEDDTYRFVHKSMLDAWQISVDDLQEIAMENLAEYARDNPLEVSLVGEDGDPRMLVPVNPNAYNSVRLLGPELHQRLRQLLGAELVVGIPNRDFFVAVSLNHPNLIGEIREQVARDFRSMHHPLTSRLLVVSADGVSEYCDG